MSVALCMIVRDAADTIEACIASAREHVDQVCVYLAGESSDGTAAIVADLAARPGTPVVVQEGEWRNDFAWAREQSFAMADQRHEWIIWLDSDDVLVHGESLRGLVRSAPPILDWLVVNYDYFDTDHGPWITKRGRVARRANVKWLGVVHEDLHPDPPQRFAVTTTVPPEQLLVRHLRREPRPHGYYLAALEAATDDLDRTPHAYLNLGKELLFLGRPTAAAAALERFVDERHDLLAGPEHNWARIEGLNHLASAYERLGDDGRATELRAESERARAASERAVADLSQQLLSSMRPAPALGRNDPCWCGSGKKFKRCHGA